MAPKSDRLAADLFAKTTTKLLLATTIAAFWLTVVPIPGAVANEQISAARAAAIHKCNLLAARTDTRVGQHPNPSVSDLHGPTWPTRMIGKTQMPQVALKAIMKMEDRS